MKEFILLDIKDGKVLKSSSSLDKLKKLKSELTESGFYDMNLSLEIYERV